MKSYNETLKIYDPVLRNNKVPAERHQFYHKWVRYYLDFCEKYTHPPRSPESLNPFITKLEQKGNSETDVRQAQHAIHLLYKLIPQSIVSKSETPKPADPKPVVEINPTKGWPQALDALKKSIQVKLIGILILLTCSNQYTCLTLPKQQFSGTFTDS